jgi:short-subunit dehydrogenase
MGLPKPRPGGAALVTGASAGIGEAVARELAKRGHDLILVARREDRLQELAGALDVHAEVIACDLAEPQQRDTLAQRVAALGLEVDVLVNNAGFATGGPFAESPAEREVAQVRVLVEAVVALTSAFLPAMVQRRSGAILNVASTAGMQPLPFSAGYSAAKAHALTFSEALHAEVKGRGVTVTALCPGPVSTEFWDVAGDQPIEDSVPGPFWVSAEQAARAGVRGLQHGERVVVPGMPMQAVVQAGRLVPNALKLPVMARTMGRRKR